jgi:uncharacterized membrane protein
LVGWGAFNLLEGLVDHQWLSLHHVHPGAGQMAWDLAFLAWGGAMLLAGIRPCGRRRAPARGLLSLVCVALERA